MRTLTMCLTMIAVLLSLNGRVDAQIVEDRLQDKRITIRMRDQPLAVVFDYLINKCDVPIGLEHSTANDADVNFVFDPNIAYREPGKFLLGNTYSGQKLLFNVDFKDASLAAVLNEIKRQMVNYKWEIVDDVVNFTPIKDRSKVFEDLLNVKIRRFTFLPDRIDLLRTKVMDLPEIVTFLKETKTGFTSAHPHWKYARRHLNSEMDFSEVTFRELLNKITKIKRGGWILRRDYGGKINAESGLVLLEL